VPDHDAEIRLGHKTVALHHVSHGVFPIITEVRLGVVVHDTVRIEAVHNLFSQIPVPLLQGVFTVEPRGAKKRDILEFRSSLEQVLEDHGDRNPSMAVLLCPAFDSIGEPDDDLLVWTAQFLERRKTKRVVESLARGLDWIYLRGIRIRLAVAHHHRAIGQLHPHPGVAIIQKDFFHF